MRVVVVGATGNVGSSLIESLNEEPGVDSVLGLSRRLPDWKLDKIEWAAADIAEDDLVPHFRGADVVVHLGWLFQPTHDPMTTWRVNTLGGVRVFRAVASAGVPALVYASSVGAYSPGPKERPVDETWPTHGWPEAAYTREKAYLERVLDSFEREHPALRVVRMRPGFVFKRESAAEQRRLFAGSLLPRQLIRPDLIPMVPRLAGLRFQVVHSADAADAYRRAIVERVRGAFNIAAEPVIDSEVLAGLFGAKAVSVPTWPLRTALAAAWHLRMVPASPQLFDAVLRLPIMDVSRARAELGWRPQHTSVETMREFIEGLRQDAGMRTPPLNRGAGARPRDRRVPVTAGATGRSSANGGSRHG